MKRISLFTLFLVSVFFLSSCSAAKVSNYAGALQAGGYYKDGMYYGIGDAWEYGNEDATITIKNGKIDEVVLRKLDLNGYETDYSVWNGQNGRPKLDLVRKTLAHQMVIVQGSNVPDIEGSSLSCENWKRAAQRALDEAKKG